MFGGLLYVRAPEYKVCLRNADIGFLPIHSMLMVNIPFIQSERADSYFLTLYLTVFELGNKANVYRKCTH